MTLDQIREWYEANKGRIVPEEQEMMIKMIGELLAEAERLAWFEDRLSPWDEENYCIACGRSYYARNGQHTADCEFVAHQRGKL